jgi:hypothetical protein
MQRPLHEGSQKKDRKMTTETTTEERNESTWEARKISRRKLLTKTAAGGVALAALYVAPQLTASTPPAAYASITDIPGLQGCTPGFWKQSQHFDSWIGYTPGQSFNTVFGVTATGNPTLLQALSAGGGGERALGRHAVAALLSSANPEVNYAYTTGQVIAAVQGAYASGDFQTVKNQFEAQNEKGCPLS